MKAIEEIEKEINALETKLVIVRELLDRADANDANSQVELKMEISALDFALKRMRRLLEILQPSK